MNKFLLAMLLVPGLVFGQGSVSGIVIDSLTGEPLPFATVFVNSSQHFLRSLYENNLEENGYRLLRPDVNNGNYVPIDISSYSIPVRKEHFCDRIQYPESVS